MQKAEVQGIPTAFEVQQQTFLPHFTVWFSHIFGTMLRMCSFKFVIHLILFAESYKRNSLSTASSSTTNQQAVPLCLFISFSAPLESMQ